MNWISYAITIIITSIIVSIITENSVIKRLQLGEGVIYKNGRCILKNGYGPTA
jgi:hypothetical protein